MDDKKTKTKAMSLTKLQKLMDQRFFYVVLLFVFSLFEVNLHKTFTIPMFT